ncbi:MAG: right-handed parallel beta-helix repeat-containing protein [Deltaproteobacteria bacterium]|nr:right-handed parallel beta-helix repeat-containing protein [Deltaproteobacteria bacterium]
MRPRVAYLLALTFSVAALGGCTAENVNYCDKADPTCPAGKVCNVMTKTCEEPRAADATVDRGDPDGGVPPDTGVDTALWDLGEEKLGLGDACQQSEQCESGFCADGVCCNGTCEGTCRSCAVEGRAGVCSNVALHADPDGDCAASSTECAGSCNGAGGCLYPQSTEPCGEVSCSEGALTSGVCDGAGVCELMTTPCGGYACSGDGASCRADCTDAAHCTDGAQCLNGACVSNLALGASCGTNNAACGSGFCADGVCCNEACGGDCHVCSAQGVCSAEHNVPCGDPNCSEAALSTFSCNQGSCDANVAPCAPYICAPSAASCATTCGDDDDCLGGYYCDANGKCLDKKANGVDCGAAHECESAICTAEGVCCNTACDADCETCYRKAKCSPKSAGSACAGMHEDTCSSDLDDLIQPQCDGVKHDCQEPSVDCGAFFCIARSGDDVCATTCSENSDCQSGICDRHFALKNKCVPESEICFVSTVHCPASGAKGTRGAPYCTINDCVSRSETYISVDDGVYTESLTLQANTQMVAPKSTRPAALGVKVRIEAPGESAINANNYTLGLYGFEVVHAVGATNTSGLIASGVSGKLTIDSCYVHHGQLYGVVSETSLELRHSSIDWNGSSAIVISGGKGTIEDSWVTWNSFGGAIPAVHVLQGTLMMKRTQVDGNGAGVKVDAGSAAILDCSVSYNTHDGVNLKLDSPGIIINGLMVNNGGYGLRLGAGTLIATNVTLAYNDEDSYRQAECVGSIRFHNTIIWDTVRYERDLYSGAECTFAYSNLAAGGASGTNISAAPEFVSTDFPFNYAIKAASGCVDKGNNKAPGLWGLDQVLVTEDILGNPRYVNGRVDMGAYEYQSTTHP